MEERLDNPAVFPQMSVAEVLRLLPQAVNVFEEAGINYSCKGACSLAGAAAAAGFTCDELIARIAGQPRGNAVDWSTRQLVELTRFLTADHETSVGHSIPALRAALETLAVRHPSFPELRRAARLLADLTTAVTTHAAHEERDLFPCIAQLEAASAGNGEEPPRVRIGQLVLREFVEHEAFREQLRSIRELCSRVHLDPGMEELFVDLLTVTASVHYHMYLENNVLYPRAIELENALRTRDAAVPA